MVGAALPTALQRTADSYVDLKNVQTGEEVVKHLSKEQEADASNFVTSDGESCTRSLLSLVPARPSLAAHTCACLRCVSAPGVELETIEKQQLVEWFANNYKNFGAQLEFVTNRSQEGSQFVKGFGGIGGILRYKVDFMEHDYDDEEDIY